MNEAQGLIIKELIKRPEFVHLVVDSLSPYLIREKSYIDEKLKEIWVAYINATRKWETSFRRTMVSYFYQQEAAVLKNMGNPSKSIEKGIYDLWMFPEKEWNDKLAAEGEAFMKKVISEYGPQVMKNLSAQVSTNANLSFNVYNPQVTQFIKNTSYENAVRINEETASLLQKNMKEGLEAGESMTDMAKRVENVFDNCTSYRANMIARTETIRATNGGALYAYHQSGVVKEKMWYTADDERRCPLCLKLNKKKIPFDDMFVSGGNKVQAPPLHPNCRCTIVAIVKEAYAPVQTPAPVVTSAPPEAKPPIYSPVAPPLVEEAAPLVWEEGKKFEEVNNQLYDKFKVNLYGYQEQALDKVQGVKFGNFFGKELLRMTETIPRLGEIIETSGSCSLSFYNSKMLDIDGTAGRYSHYKNAIEIATKGVRMEGAVAPGAFSSCNSYRQTATHEYSHHLWFKGLKGDGRTEWAKLFDEMGGKDGKWWKKKVSVYASTDSKEAFSESFTIWSHKDYGKDPKKLLPKEIEDYMTKTFGEKKAAAVPKVKPAEFNTKNLEMIPNTQGGSMPGAQYVDKETKKKYYVKFYPDPDQARTEYAANRIYSKLGINAPEIRLSEMDNPFTGKKSLAVATDWMDGLRKLKPEEYWEHRQQISEVYNSSVLLKNWDCVGTGKDNMILDPKTKKVFVIDSGGSLYFRAMGGHKDFEINVGEYTTFKKGSTDAAQIFKPLFDKDVFLEKDGALKIGKLQKEDFQSILSDAGFDTRRKNALVNALEGRKNLIIERYDLNNKKTYSGFGEVVEEMRNKIGGGRISFGTEESNSLLPRISDACSREFHDNVERIFREIIPEKIGERGFGVVENTTRRILNGWTSDSFDDGRSKVFQRWAKETFGADGNSTSSWFQEVNDSFLRNISRDYDFPSEKERLWKILNSNYEANQYYLRRLYGWDDKVVVERGFRNRSEYESGWNKRRKEFTGNPASSFSSSIDSSRSRYKVRIYADVEDILAHYGEGFSFDEFQREKEFIVKGRPISGKMIQWTEHGETFTDMSP